MEKTYSFPLDQVAWYKKPCTNTPSLQKNISCDVVVIGGGIAGLSAAQNFAQHGASVTLIEKKFCGSGASGKSSGFITPDSELSLDDIAKKYGIIEAKKIWDFITSGIDLIQNNITHYSLACDYQKQDTLVLASNKRGFIKEILPEYETRKNAGYEAQLYTSDQLSSIISSQTYQGALRYNNTFGINAFAYCQSMKKVLQDQHVAIYENTPALNIENNKVHTPQGIIQAHYIIICTDYLTPQLIQEMKYKIYHAQTFVMLSKTLSDKQIQSIFPKNRYMAWDTDLIYHYFRVTPDNRLMIGGANLLYTYASHAKHHSKYMRYKLTHYIQKKFPNLHNIEFEYMWPGLIGISKDLFPIAGFDKNMPSVYYATASAGLPFASALGIYSSHHILHKKNVLNAYLSPYRSVTLGKTIQKILGTKLTFALNNFLTVSSL